MSSRPLLSVVIAARDPPPDELAACVQAFAERPRHAEIEVVLVASGNVPALPPALSAKFAAVQRLTVAPAGIYAAYNDGLAAARGRYVVFFGTDDRALPGIDRVLDRLARDDRTLHVAVGELQGHGLRRPARTRAGLTFRNWCHQAVFYPLALVGERRFRVEYRVRADHALNLALAARAPRIEYGTETVVYCAAGGLSASTHDARFEADLPALAGAEFGRPYALLVRLKQRVERLLLGPAEKRFRVRPR